MASRTCARITMNGHQSAMRRLMSEQTNICGRGHNTNLKQWHVGFYSSPTLAVASRVWRTCTRAIMCHKHQPEYGELCGAQNLGRNEWNAKVPPDSDSRAEGRGIKNLRSGFLLE